MSNALAIAAVTAVLKDLLNNGLIDHDVSSHLGSVQVTALPPDRIPVNQGGPCQLNLFMYQVTSDPSWRNEGLPSRDAAGSRISDHPLALNLHYLLTAYGGEELQSEILLGYAMQILHETPILTRDAVRRALQSPSPVSGSILPEPFRSLGASELADQVEEVKIYLENQSTEELSKLWSAFQAHYRPTAAYQTSVVLIRARRPGRAALPVLTLGPANSGVSASAGLIPPYPGLFGVAIPDRRVSATLDDTLTITGHHLAGEEVTVRFTEARTGRALTATVQPGALESAVAVRLADATDQNLPPGSTAEKTWTAGLYRLAVSARKTGETEARVSNEIPLVLAPAVVFPITAATDSEGRSVLTVNCRPEVAAGQRVSLIVADRELLLAPLAAPAAVLTFAGRIPPGRHRVRLRVDGIDSNLVDRTKRPPVFDSAQEVVLP